MYMYTLSPSLSRPLYAFSLFLIPYILQYSLTHSYYSQCYGYDCQKRSNLLAIDTDTLLYTAGNYLVFVSISTGGHIYLRSLGGKSIGAITVSVIL